VPYIQRDGTGQITGLYANKQEYATEILGWEAPEVQAYLNPPEQEKLAESASDARILAALVVECRTRLAGEKCPHGS